MRWCASWLLLLAGCGGVAAAPRPFSGTLPEVHDGSRLVVVGDLQRTAPVLEFFREQNDEERARVVAAIAEARPDLVAITGDCVFHGGSEDQWAAFDRLAEPLHARGVPAIAAFGNHEYWEGKDEAEKNLFARFPLDAGRHWFAVAFGPLRLVVLDTNEDPLGETEWQFEVGWFERALADFDQDPAVRGVIVLQHHPPYTNSTVTGDEAHVQKYMVPPFARAKKTLAMMTGHVHSYERFLEGGKMYVVSGGGGGPRAELLTGDARRHRDDLFVGPALRDFHFTVYTLAEDGLRAEVRGIPKGGTTFAVIDRFALPWPR